MRNRTMTECPYCEGNGDVMDGRRIHGGMIDPPIVSCPECCGSGEVEEDNLEHIDPNKTLSEYEQDYKDMAAEARWERERDGD